MPWPHYCFTCSELEVVPSLCHVRPHFHILAILRREKIGLLQETHSAQAQKCRVGEGGLSDILGLDAVNVGGAETHVHTMQYIWNDSAFLWHKSWRGVAATNTSWQIFHWRLIWLMPAVLQLRAKIWNANFLQCITVTFMHGDINCRNVFSRAWGGGGFFFKNHPVLHKTNLL